MLLQNTDELAQFSPPDRILFSKILRAYNKKQTEEYTQLFETLTPNQQSDFIQYKAILDRKEKLEQPAVTTAYVASKAAAAPLRDAKEADGPNPDKRPGCCIS
ncbi:MAG: hypothetical protein AB7I18_07675 [Candidatus Berkiella sp.]